MTDVTASAAQATAFYAEATRDGCLWAVRDSAGFPAPKNGEGVRAMPFWSLRSRAEKVIADVPAFANFEPVKISLSDFRGTWLPNLTNNGLHVGLNWSGPRATGYDVAAATVEAGLAAL